MALAGLVCASPGAETPAAVPLSLDECLRRVYEYNETIQIRELEWEVSQKKVKAERGIFEPQFVGSIQHVQNLEQTTAEQRISLATAILDEKNNLYDSGVEFLLPTGGKLKFGYSLQQLNNNLQLQFGLAQEYSTFGGVTLTQPLLKGAGYAATMAGIRLAAGESDLAYQDYRRQFMLILAQAESAYWDLYYFQDLQRILGESAGVARTILKDDQVRLQAGQSSELEVLAAESGLALREAKAKDAHHKLVEAMNRLTALFSAAGAYSNLVVRAMDRPTLRATELDYFSSMGTALKWNPDYLSQLRQVTQADIRLAYAHNQRWPQVDLKASYGLNGLGDTYGSSWSQLQTAHYENWSLGVEVHMPLGGDIRGRNELSAAKLRKQQALLGLKNAEVQISTALDTAIKRTQGLRDSVGDFQKAVDYNQRLLDAEVARLAVGKSDSRKVLEIEEELSEAKRALLESLVAYEKSYLEWELGRGTLLRMQNVDMTQTQLRDRLVQRLHLSPGATGHLFAEAKTSYEKPAPAPAPAGPLTHPGPTAP
ncbi:MAG: TolC family protein [Verrucomicrobia bacterium]|nr:TolC family protein [Verrucomicrobiota bacterium]